MEDIEYTKKLRCCANCKFGNGTVPKLHEGTYKDGEHYRYWDWCAQCIECRFNPPVAIMPDNQGDGEVQIFVEFPKMDDSDWCWQFKNKFEES